MEDSKPTVTTTVTDYASSSLSRYAHLIDIPLSDRILDALISLFNYFDIYAPKMPVLYAVVTYIRFFQLVGGAFMAENVSSFKPGTLAYDTISYISILFHAIPLQYRLGNGAYVLFAFNGILILFGIYLLATAFVYKKTTKVSRFSIIALSAFMAIGPYILTPLITQYTGQIISALIMKERPVNAKDVAAIVMTIVVVSCYLWIMIRSYSSSLVFRPCSFQSIEGSPQNKLYVTTIWVTFVFSLTTYFTRYPSAAMIILSIFFYAYSASTVFRCGTFIKHQHKVMALGGSILGTCLCAANIYSCLVRRPWGSPFFVGVVIVAVIVFVSVHFYLKGKEHRALCILDELNDTQDITMIKNKNKLKELISCGFMYSHPICCSLTIFKLAIEQWKEAVDIWALYAKFTAIYPERLPQLEFIALNINQLNIKSADVSIVLSSIGQITKTRETKYTPQLKYKISKLSKMFNKTKNRLRNIWDLILQGNVAELNTAIKRTKESVSDCSREMNFLNMQYPNNRYVARQNVLFFTDILGDPLLGKKAIETMQKVSRGYRIQEDTVHELGIIAFPNIPEYALDVESSTKLVVDSETPLEDNCNFMNDETFNFDALEQISNQISKHKVPAIKYIFCSTIVAYIILILIPFITMMVYFEIFQNTITKPTTFMEGIALTRNVVAMLNCFVGRLIFQELEDPLNPGQTFMGRLQLATGFSMSAFGNTRDTRDIITYIASDVSYSNELMAKVRSFRRGNPFLDRVRKLLSSNSINFSYYLNNTFAYSSFVTVADVSFMLATHVGKLLDYEKITTEVVNGADSITSRNNNNLATQTMNDALDVMIEYLVSMG
ncbi:hypothetical protein TVAG_194440 [Trichomonas vaginalis G3]|uniref:Uncharacterized protein n=1 Tax=Trichomonas vaginalis (strain ATCC PRA-98 / G3) TaxID=412133 RepID=A2ESB5_TRIV3|nr:hypothetical protein TVAG_194440 [Trichomonas vaginalis G3]|eukprot:XP_001316702.1 hypothetical protein [Trichomonas vaginalis G3]